MLVFLLASLSAFAFASDFEGVADCLQSRFSKLENYDAISAAVVSLDKEVTLNFGQATDDRIYEIGSITKTMTGNLLAMAMLERKINFHDSIPGHWQKGPTPIKYTHLVTHTSGLPSKLESYWEVQDPTWPYGGLTKNRFRSIYPFMKLDFLPGEKYRYSNAGMATLGLVLEETYGKSFESLVQEKIFKPLGMTSSYFKVPDEELHRFPQGRVNRSVWPYWDIYATAYVAAGGVRSTIVDMAKYVRANLEGDVAELAHKPIYNRGEVSNAMGWFTNPAKGTIFHDGSTIAFNSVLVISKKKGIGVISMTDTGYYTKDGYDFSFYDVAFECLN